MRTVVLGGLLAGYLLANVSAAAPEPHWAVDPDLPGPNQPAAGRSLFDVLFAAHGGHEIPFPFESLLASIESHLDPEESPSRVLIPLGRSLQREAAAPHYFRFPRVVVAIDTEPRHQPGYVDVFLKSLLFLGYQEKSNTIEVISYNDEAARFEFQVVSDYGIGLTPNVAYAERAVCTSCHQNGGPIFSEVPWSETDGSLPVSMMIEAFHPEYYDKPLFSRGTHTAWAVDYATDRANYFASYQLLWKQGCGHETPLRETSVRCRAAVLEAIIKHRLNGAWFVDSSAETFQSGVVDNISTRWNDLWPGGIYVPTANIPDRNPFTEIQLIDQLDPLYRRAPRAHWSRPATEILNGIVVRLSEFLSHNDIKRIDTELLRHTRAKPAPGRRLLGTCNLRFDGPDKTRLMMECDEDPAGFGLKAWIELTDKRATRGRLISVRIDGAEQTLRVDLEPVTLDYQPEGRLWLSFEQTRHMNPRQRNGNLIESLELTWDRVEPTRTFRAEAALTIRFDFSIVSDAIERLVLRRH